MRKISEPSKFRENVVVQLQAFFDSKKLAGNVEKSIYNFSIKEADRKNVVRKWDNTFFVQIYTDRLRSIYFNIKNNKNFLDQIISKQIRSAELAHMTHQEMDPERWDELIKTKMERDKNRYEAKQTTTSDMKCFKCNKNECTYYQMQTRSADEPMTTFVTCQHCGARWRF